MDIYGAAPARLVYLRLLNTGRVANPVAFSKIPILHDFVSILDPPFHPGSLSSLARPCFAFPLPKNTSDITQKTAN